MLYTLYLSTCKHVTTNILNTHLCVAMYHLYLEFYILFIFIFMHEFKYDVYTYKMFYVHKYLMCNRFMDI